MSVCVVRRGKYRFDPEYWQEISGDAKDFVAGLLTLDTKRRMTAQEVLDHPWIKNLAELPTKELKGATERLAQFQKEQKVNRSISNRVRVDGHQRVACSYERCLAH